MIIHGVFRIEPHECTECCGYFAAKSDAEACAVILREAAQKRKEIDEARTREEYPDWELPNWERETYEVYSLRISDSLEDWKEVRSAPID